MEGKTRRDPASFEAKRRAILKAATRVFARKGFVGTRVGDIAREAGIAYGLIYHYFDNKDAILHSLFAESWGLSIKVVQDIDAQGGDLRAKLVGIVDFFLQAWRLEPDLVEVVMREVLRSPKFLEADNFDHFKRIFVQLERILREHADELRPGTDPRLTALLFLGSLEILLTGFVARELLGEDPETIASSGTALVDTFLRGIARD
jgi:TetR/AcrR family fatty acid metabolism transcriptional regulator